ncbi:hypothetical protein M5K25_008971 [Dendrobium thyrsiflorum]|uniref:Uncharacterized protein n=1 Tax=Dendrobium thyrsiflorum TaxID=117978 RepID=A0ABD0V9T6_DENTH
MDNFVIYDENAEIRRIVTALLQLLSTRVPRFGLARSLLYPRSRSFSSPGHLRLFVPGSNRGHLGDADLEDLGVPSDCDEQESSDFPSNKATAAAFDDLHESDETMQMEESELIGLQDEGFTVYLFPIDSPLSSHESSWQYKNLEFLQYGNKQHPIGRLPAGSPRSAHQMLEDMLHWQLMQNFSKTSIPQPPQGRPMVLSKPDRRTAPVSAQNNLSLILIRCCNRFVVSHNICSSHSLLSSPAKSDGIMPLLHLPSLHIQTISSSHNPKPKSPSPHPPLLLRFRPSDRQIAQHLNTLGIRASPSSSSESLHWMLTVVNYFESKGFSNIHFPRLFHLCPQIFSSADINRTIAPVFSFLISELGASTEQSRDFIVRCPELLNCNAEFRLRPTLVFLREIGVYNLHVPSILNANLLIIPVGQLGSRIRFLESMGLSYEESAGICRRFPSIFRYSEENNLRPKFEYLLYEMGGSVEEVKRFPQYFGFCLKKRIVPRHLHLKQRNIRPSLKWMLMPGDKKFYGKAIGSTGTFYFNGWVEVTLDVRLTGALPRTCSVRTNNNGQSPFGRADYTCSVQGKGCQKGLLFVFDHILPDN